MRQVERNVAYCNSHQATFFSQCEDFCSKKIARQFPRTSAECQEHLLTGDRKFEILEFHAFETKSTLTFDVSRKEESKSL